MTITREQCRAARALLNWSQKDLAEASGVGESTIIRFESDSRKPHTNTLESLRATLEAAGVVFTPATATTSPGLCLRNTKKK